MQYRAIATDFDGTLATDGVVEAATVAAMARWRAAGGKMILISGRMLDDFLAVFPQVECFDAVVVENGAVIYRPADQSVTLLGEPPPPDFLDTLKAQIADARQAVDVPEEFETLVSDRRLPSLDRGRVIVATWTPFDAIAQSLIESMNLTHHIILNKGAVMILPLGVNKAVGLARLLPELDLLPQQVVGVGDAENDIDFLEVCGLAVAVDNALPSVKAIAHWVTQASRGAGVAEMIDRLLAGNSIDSTP
ncbi:MAG: Cof-type HAD-IIB family hydrolase [Kaiparowitsia implicata GSE-PSE-MK54-09C]|nr:Cof-type HAD-IIB family hydrolase [Kaiparowitsia implicata GSE-PSE-MK54-09C]